MAEIDETYVLESFKGRKARMRGAKAAKRGLSREQIPVPVARDRSGATTDRVLTDSRKAAVTEVLRALLPSDAVVCTDGGGSVGQAVKDLGLEHHPVVTSCGTHTIGAWHIQNVDAYHGRFNGWMRRLHGVATRHLENDLGWLRAPDRAPRTAAQPAHVLDLALRT